MEAGQSRRGREPVARSSRRPKAGVWVRSAVATAVVVLSVAGAAMWWQRSAVGGSSTTTLGGLQVVLGPATEAAMDHADHSAGGYQMPAQMMPGAPQGDDRRIGVPITLVNDGDEVRTFDPAAEFALDAGPTTVPLHSSTIGGLRRLWPGAAVRGVLFFDTDPAEHGGATVVLLWHRAGEERRLTLPPEPAPPQSPPTPGASLPAHRHSH